MVKVKYISGVYILESHQIINGSLSDVWNFFSQPNNLEKITPSDVQFKITSGNQVMMFSGQIITYTIGLFKWFRTHWITEISHVVHESFFVDKQLFGPYKMWHHQHHFDQVSRGVKMYDRVVYKVPFGWVGRVVHSLFLKNVLIKIFNYRAKQIENYFGSVSIDQTT